MTAVTTAPLLVSDPLLLRKGDVWIACAEASGPFTGLQGGAVGAIMAAEIERAAPKNVRPLSIRVEFLRRVPVQSALMVEVRALQRGRRVAVFEALLSCDGRLHARAQMTLAAPTPIPLLTEPFESQPHNTSYADPEGGISRKPRSPHGGPWLMDSLDGRISGDGLFWFRWNRPLMPPEFQSPFTSLLPPPTGRMGSHGQVFLGRRPQARGPTLT